MRRSSPTDPPIPSPCARGFTLVEMLVAFTILAVALVALMQVFGTGFRGLRASEAHARAVMQARSTLERVGTEVPLQPGEWAGTFEDGSRWTTRVRAYEPDAEQAAQTVVPYEVEVTVTWDGDRSVSLKTLRLAPRQ